MIKALLNILFGSIDPPTTCQLVVRVGYDIEQIDNREVGMKKYLQACEMGGSIYGKKRQTSKQPVTRKSRGTKQDVVMVYNKFYKDQVAALYKAIHNTK